ncbi:hypothetical protein P842_01968 [Enterobacter roggenkampii UCI 39]|nr:hypothetical protein P842_01968 [Enterobacter roggenkampii UCI 39]BBV91322.1 hypothetical protein STW0522ENT66_17490 [Enterobacter roggenkampii]SAE29106.1 Uncharacterised protein [Enterobacter roggenkampii]
MLVIFCDTPFPIFRIVRDNKKLIRNHLEPLYVYFSIKTKHINTISIKFIYVYVNKNEISRLDG